MTWMTWLLSEPSSANAVSRIEIGFEPFSQDVLDGAEVDTNAARSADVALVMPSMEDTSAAIGEAA